VIGVDEKILLFRVDPLQGDRDTVDVRHLGCRRPGAARQALTELRHLSLEPLDIRLEGLEPGRELGHGHFEGLGQPG